MMLGSPVSDQRHSGKTACSRERYKEERGARFRLALLSQPSKEN
jgi:hypothetical protein